MKKILYDHSDYYCSITSKLDFTEKLHSYGLEIRPSKNDKLNEFIINLEGENWNILWPNREGEIFTASQVIANIKKYNTPAGLTLSYPATASCRTFIFMEADGTGFAFLAPPDTEGRVTEFRLNAGDRQHVTITIRGKSSTWNSIKFNSINELEEKISELRSNRDWVSLSPVNNNARWQVQVGLIGPDGKTDVPVSRGFDVLSDISSLMLKNLGENQILHIFGYSKGHDMGYPDYTPSSLLGGMSNLKKAIENIHCNKQKAIFYMNGRIAQIENIEKEILHDSVLKDNSGTAITEIYGGRMFYVMDPSSIEWQDRLVSEAMALKELGADGVQLDQLGGRAALVEPGGIWGKGYIKLIKRIGEAELTVWIQGLSDIYPADWFELTYRDIDILADGTIRGGTPLGKPDKRVFQLSVPAQTLLIPLSKLRSSEDLQNEKTIIDLDNKIGGLFLYSSVYIEQLEAIMHRAVNSLVNDATAALR